MWNTLLPPADIQSLIFITGSSAEQEMCLLLTLNTYMHNALHSSRLVNQLFYATLGGREEQIKFIFLSQESVLKATRIDIIG